MGNDDPSDDEANLSDSSHVHFEGDELDTKYNKNRVRQGGPRKRTKIKKQENEAPDIEHVGATPYTRVATVVAVRTMLLQ